MTDAYPSQSAKYVRYLKRSPIEMFQRPSRTNATALTFPLARDTAPNVLYAILLYFY